jgi:hypothetical protein
VSAHHTHVGAYSSSIASLEQKSELIAFVAGCIGTLFSHADAFVGAPFVLHVIMYQQQMESSSADLEKRIAALEKGAEYDATQALIRQREQEFLTTLRNIKAAMVVEGASGGANSTETEALKTENERLKANITKQEHRIRHLISGFEKLMA